MGPGEGTAGGWKGRLWTDHSICVPEGPLVLAQRGYVTRCWEWAWAGAGRGRGPEAQVQTRAIGHDQPVAPWSLVKGTRRWGERVGK